MKKQPKNLNEELKLTNMVVKDGLRNAASHHVESFNYSMEKCLPRINQYMLTAEVAKPDKPTGDVVYPFKKMNIWFEDFELKQPERIPSNQAANLLLDDEGSNSNKMYPYECRLRSLSYTAPLYATIARKFDNEPEEKVTLCLG